MRKKKFKLLAGMAVLSTNLLFTGCSSKTSDTEEVVMESTEDTIEESTDNNSKEPVADNYTINTDNGNLSDENSKEDKNKTDSKTE